MRSFKKEARNPMLADRKFVKKHSSVRHIPQKKHLDNLREDSSLCQGLAPEKGVDASLDGTQVPKRLVHLEGPKRMLSPTQFWFLVDISVRRQRHFTAGSQRIANKVDQTPRKVSTSRWRRTHTASCSWA